MAFNIPSISSPWPLLLHATLLIVSLTCDTGASYVDRKVHIVYMGDRPKGVLLGESLHRSMLEKVAGRDASELLVCSYKRSFNGFAAMLSEVEANKIASMDQVVSVFPSKIKKLHTTRSWNFIGFPVDAKRESYESDVIIGMLDTGIWPESDSFHDKGFGPPPTKWKGTCQSMSNFTCNNKIIGAKYYNYRGKFHHRDIASPRDTAGHGSHTSSTAAGLQVGGVNLYGLAEGIARGSVPSARIAVYKICWHFGCNDVDILAAFDDAIADGVDIISLSVGGHTQDYFSDSIAIGAFHSMKNGILTSNSAGNNGPSLSSVVNNSPWSLTVAASTIDRRFVAKLKLGNDEGYEGSAITTLHLKDKMYPLVYGGDVPDTFSDSSLSRYCYDGTLNVTAVTGAVVLCDEVADGGGPLLAGAVGSVMLGEFTDYANVFPIPTTVLGPSRISDVYRYINTTSQPTAHVGLSKEVTDPRAPFVVSFSSRGPNSITSDILKPDLTAPGVDIIAAWSPVGPVSQYVKDKRSVNYNMDSGTSMACPHATGAAAYVKSFHPDWSPAAIKSALMTTAYPMETSSNSDMEFAYGSGQLNPTRAVDPGLVYDAGEADYVSMLCGQGYSTTNLQLVTGDNSSCTKTDNGTVWDLNYPSFALSVSMGKPFSASFNRTVTNVGLPDSAYKAIVTTSSGVEISIEPSTFSFKSQMEKKSFTLKVEGVISKKIVSASLLLSDGVHNVRSPIVVYN